MSTTTKKPHCDRCNPLPSDPTKITLYTLCPECDQVTKTELLKKLHAQREENGNKVLLGIEALERLLPVLAGRSGQSYTVRGILFSLWNGEPYSWLEVVSLDTVIRKDLAVLVTSWGADGFFYHEMKTAVSAAGQWGWFIAHVNQLNGEGGL